MCFFRHDKASICKEFTKEFIDNTLREVCEKEKKLLQMRQFFASLEAMHWLEKTFLF